MILTFTDRPYLDHPSWYDKERGDRYAQAAGILAETGGSLIQAMTQAAWSYYTLPDESPAWKANWLIWGLGDFLDVTFPEAEIPRFGPGWPRYLIEYVSERVFTSIEQRVAFLQSVAAFWRGEACYVRFPEVGTGIRFFRDGGNVLSPRDRDA